MSGRDPRTTLLLGYLQAAAVAVVLVLLAFTVVVGRDLSIIATLLGALTVLLGLTGLDVVNRRNGR